MADKFATVESGLTSPATRVTAITPDDSADLDEIVRAIRADAGGAITIVPVGNGDAETVTLSVAAGEIVPIRTRRVLATGTDGITLHGLI